MNDSVNYGKRVICVELMDEVNRSIVARRTCRSWKAARRTGVAMLKAETDEKLYIRLYDLHDASDVDFITRARLKKSTGIAVAPDGKELKPRGKRKSNHNGTPTKEYIRSEIVYGTRKRKQI